VSHDELLLVAGVLAVAFLYSTVGHAGASGYIAIMALLGMAPDTIKPVALMLNVLVAGVATWQFRRAGHFCWPLFWPFAVVAVPAAFLGGYLDLPAPEFRVAVGLVLWASAARFLLDLRHEGATRPPARGVALAVGGGLGLLAGLTGTGGGIFLTPLLILRGWAATRGAAAVSAPFILCNSLAGLAGHVSATHQVPALVLPLAAAVLAGGAAGSWLGSVRLPPVAVRRLLAAVLGIAGGKLVLA
jgi:uncharacterized protein